MAAQSQTRIETVIEQIKRQHEAGLASPGHTAIQGACDTKFLVRIATKPCAVSALRWPRGKPTVSGKSPRDAASSSAFSSLDFDVIGDAVLDRNRNATCRSEAS